MTTPTAPGVRQENARCRLQAVRAELYDLISNGPCEDLPGGGKEKARYAVASAVATVERLYALRSGEV
jgi:hypothetical protein